VSETRPVVGDPNLDPKLRACAESVSDAVVVVLEAAKRLRHDDSLAQLQALALHGTIIELLSECVLLAKWGEPTGIPILLRSLYEGLVDLDNLLRDKSYVCRMEHANIAQTLKIMSGGLLRKDFLEGRKEEYEQLRERLAELEGQGNAKLSIRKRCEAVGRLDEYEGIYGLFGLDTHNNASALAERHLAERKDGIPVISFFGLYDPQQIVMRLYFGLQWLFHSAQMIHGAFKCPAPELDQLAERFQRERRDAMRGNPELI
jgi:uncharacterized protein DUF5677